MTNIRHLKIENIDKEKMIEKCKLKVRIIMYMEYIHGNFCLKSQSYIKTVCIR